MQLKGLVTVKIIDSDGYVKQELNDNNLIFDATWLGLMATNPVKGYFVKNISIAQDTSTPVASNPSVTNVIGTCTPVSPNPIWVDTVDPPYGTLTGLINPTGTSRTFNSVALTNLSSADVQSVASTTALCRLLLSIPCTQGAGDFVNITYSIQFIDNVGDGFVSKKLNRYEFGACLFNQGSYEIGRLYTCFCNAYNTPQDIPIASQNIALAGSSNPDLIWDSSAINSTNFKWNYQLNKGRNTWLGFILNALTQGLSDTTKNQNKAYALTRYSYNKEPIQTGFKKAGLSTVPFFDPGRLASSTGVITISGNWNKKLPEFYTITFYASGSVGTATYRFSVLKHVGFQGNTFTPLVNKTLYRTPGYKFETNLHGWQQEDFDIHKLSETEIVQFDTTGVSLVDLFDGTNKSWDTTTTPALSVLNIRQIALDTTNRLIYVACRITGLWIIDINANTTNLQINQPCYGVDVGRNNVAIAIVEGGLRRSLNWAVNETFTFAGITDNNWANVYFLKADPSNTNDQICIVANNNTNNRLVWYQFSNNTATSGYSATSVKTYPGSLDVSDTNSLWVLFDGSNFGQKVNFGGSTIVTSYPAHYRTFTHSVYGSQNFSKITFYKDNFIGRTALYGGSDTATFSTLDGGAIPSLSALCLHLDGGICYVDYANGGTGAILQLFPSIADVSYGWDGTNWVINNTGNKTTHTTDQPLLNGLNIRFSDGSSTPHFVSTEKFTQSVNYGLLKDNATSVEIRTAWYSKTTHYDAIPTTTIATTVTLPSDSNPVFRRVDTDQYTPHKIYIDGTLVSKLWLDGTTPAPTEASFPSNGRAILTFNSADVGKTLSGYYLWLEA